jgi:hypothetical protein
MCYACATDPTPGAVKIRDTIAIQEALIDKVVDSMEKVSDEQYKA